MTAALAGACAVKPGDDPGIGLVFAEQTLTITVTGPDEHEVSLT